MRQQLTPQNYPALVEAHYRKDDLDLAILKALQVSNRDVAALKWDDLCGGDHLNFCGIKGTIALAQVASLPEKTHVLDVGCGLGGPARMLAAEFGCLVTGLDLTRTFLQAAEMLTLRTGLANSVSFQYGNALAMPCNDDAFQAVWMQHVSMNIPDKRLLFQEIWRVLKPGGKLALHTVLAGEARHIHYPVIWAVDSSLDFIEQKDAFREAISNNGFRLLEWQNVTLQTIAELKSTGSQVDKQNLPLLSNALYVNNLVEKRKNILRNLEENRIVVIQAIYEKIDQGTKSAEPLEGDELGKVLQGFIS